jgi:outer membrane protein OmpA-like peptidoglycan-associated protein
MTRERRPLYPVAMLRISIIAAWLVWAAPAAAQPIKVTYDAAHLDLGRRVLEFQVSRPIATATLVAIGEDGGQLGTGSATFDRPAPRTWLSIGWSQPDHTRVMILKLRVEAADGTATNVELIPWSVEVEHEEVNFATDSAVIEPAERAKLDASLTSIRAIVQRSQRFLKPKLFIAGHTDTVGSAAKNRKLSLDRARAIAGYFRGKGLSIPIAFAGYGEEVPRVKTPDSTDERANRRSDYVIGPAAGAPPFRGPYQKVRTSWRALP